MAPTRWPSNWEALTAQLARFFHWSPSTLDELTGERLVWWADQANAMLAAEAETRRAR